ncbi:acyltransferase family protein [Rhodopseudomonas sp. P2A-2r]|uniref:acyltransferase family protein n=1 Tax=unclassified Rhodopseudomonas TaxID=2638247 RepID=UPI00223408EE|nr:acyltransferase [Rhodopseudomonas sp. P2A-2r]UZE51650.1 acyltransferase [Rhodopseudomonas sp. P2A-2r]
MNKRSGNFDLMRLVASFMVLWSHQFALTGFPEQAIPWAATWGGFGVLIFFAISGYLNAQSLFRSQSVAVFLTSRAFRIFPALVVCVAFCIVLGACVTTREWPAYLLPEGGLFARNAPLSFLWRNSTLLFGLDYELPGVFDANIYPRAVNGSLWTLPHEVKLYLAMAIIAVCCRFKPMVFAVVMIAGVAALMLFGLARPLAPLLDGKYLATFAVIFASGAGLALLERRIGLVPALATMALLLLGFAIGDSGSAGFLVAVVIGCVVLNRVPLPSWLMPRADISYGVYLYAFPVQQLVSNWSGSFWIRLGMVVVIVTILAILSARYVEQPALRLRKRLGRSDNSGLPSRGPAH